MSKATAAVQAATAPVPLVSPDKTVAKSAIAGKNVWLINLTNTPLQVDISNAFTAAAKAAGMNPQIYMGNGAVDSWNAGVAQAVAHGADGIALSGIDPKLVSGSLGPAIAKKTVIIDQFNGDPTSPLPAGLFAHVTSDFTKDGHLMADYALMKSGCHLDAVVIGASVIGIHAEMMQGAVDEVHSLCPSCKVSSQSVDLSNLATSLASITTSAIQRDPNLNYFIPVFDAAVTYMQPAIASSGAKVGIISHDGIDAGLNRVRQGTQLADVAFPPDAWMGWALADQLAVGISGQSPANLTIPTRLIDSSNIGTSNSALFPAYSNFESAFERTWTNQ